MAERSDGQPLILVDGSSYLFRAFHALPPLTNSAGDPTGAVYGVVNMLRKLLTEYEPTHIGVVFDAPGRTFRDDLFEQYKANRPGMPEDLRPQIEPLKQIVRAMGLPLVEVGGVEADDVIGTLARQAAADGRDVIISTGDKDMAQLVTERVTLLNTMSGTSLDMDGVREKFGVPPERIIDYLALVGDTSDNIPGIPKVGPKTAVKWLDAYGDLDGVVANADAIKGKVGESLREHLDDLPLSRDLATIRCELDLDQSPDDLQRGEPDTASLRELYRQQEFSGWLSQLGDDGGEAGDADAPGGDYSMVTEQAEFDAWLARLRDAGLFAFDLETDSLNYMEANIVGLSFAIEAGEAIYIPVAHDGPGAPEQLDRQQVLDALKPLLEDPEHPKVGQNLKYDMSVLARYGIDLQGVRHDTMLQSYVLDSTATRHDMDSLALKYLGRGTTKYEDVAGKGARQITFNQVGVDEATDYACEDADVTLQLHQTLWPRVQAIPSLQAVYEAIEVPLLPVLSRMERHGVLVDRELLRTQSTELAKSMQRLEQAAHDAAGGPFNLSSPKQIQEILFERQGLPVLQKTPKGQPSTAESVLQELAADYELPRLIIEHRGLSKLKSTYTDKLPQMVNPHTNRVHTSYHQAVAATGRLSSSDPNLQNIPIRSEEGRRIRKAFIAAPGYRLMAADYSQVELRIMAHLSGDETLKRAFAERQDIHRATAAEVFGASPGQVTDEQRRAAKAINFGLIYGMSAWGLARQIGVERGEAQQYVDLYFDRFQGVKAYMDGTRARAREQGFVETVYGRRLYLPEINASNQQRRQYAERTAINAPMQGTAADIIKRAMIRVDEWLRADEPDVLMVMQVHDELVFEVPESEVDAVAARVRELMVDAATLDVPLDVDIGVGQNWEEAH
ncbi:DNA polymerase I [Aquisalimonas asiatica]|uniref:DNA polymerase I n=1 Tax=Aquisalimonas asiatica TaxID=406100 RepID=A0A1H8UAV4_9GAMM|nr:DNA polymerase I [Aquisalimonas asiatica]SEP00226.1 DNA polymerase I [Aquisalimonas asiatica]